MNSTPVPRFLLSISEYNRIHQVARGVLEDIADINRACMFFAAFGALILNKHYKIPARVVAGAFGLCVDDTPNVMFFGDQNTSQISSSPDGFHMWIQTKTHIVDFMAPIFPEAFSQHPAAELMPRKMLQRLISTECSFTSELLRAGDFITFPDPELTSTLVDGFFDNAENADLLTVAEAWFGHPRAKQKKSFSMIDNTGAVHGLSPGASKAVGSW